jgi:hypothetical protein
VGASLTTKKGGRLKYFGLLLVSGWLSGVQAMTEALEEQIQTVSDPACDCDSVESVDVATLEFERKEKSRKPVTRGALYTSVGRGLITGIAIAAVVVYLRSMSSDLQKGVAFSLAGQSRALVEILKYSSFGAAASLTMIAFWSC